MDKWGTKWDARGADLDADDEELIYTFDTAWGPPSTWAAAASALHPDLQLTLTYEEEGCDFAGECLYCNGDVVLEDEWTPSERRWDENADEVVEMAVDAVDPAQWAQWTTLSRKAFESSIKDGVDLNTPLEDVGIYDYDEFEQRVLDLLMRHHLRWFPTWQRWDQFNYDEADGANHGRRLQRAVLAALHCGHVCAALVAEAAGPIPTAAAGTEATTAGAAVDAGVESGAQTTAQLQPVVAQRGMHLPYLPPELWHVIFSYLRAADF